MPATSCCARVQYAARCSSSFQVHTRGVRSCTSAPLCLSRAVYLYSAPYMFKCRAGASAVVAQRGCRSVAHMLRVDAPSPTWIGNHMRRHWPHLASLTACSAGAQLAHCLAPRHAYGRPGADAPRHTYTFAWRFLEGIIIPSRRGAPRRGGRREMRANPPPDCLPTHGRPHARICWVPGRGCHGGITPPACIETLPICVAAQSLILL